MSHTSHITLMVSTGDGSARFVTAHPAVAERSDVLINKGLFSKYDYGTRLIVKIRMSDRYRHIMEVRPATSEEDSEEKFIKMFSRTLLTQASSLAAVSPAFEAWQKNLERILSAVKAAEAPTSGIKVEAVDKEVQDYEKKTGQYKFNAIPDGAGFWVGEVFISKEDALILASVVEMSKGNQVNVLMAGPSGYGKTSIPEAIAKNMGYKFLRLNCAQIRDPEEWFGYREARDGETVFIPTEFTKAVTGGHAVVVMDEFNRIEPWLHNTLYPLLDHARKTTVHDVEITCGEDVIFVATVNLGHQFVGTFMLDAALLNRMDAIISVSALPGEIERKLLVKKMGIDFSLATKIVSVMSVLRGLVEQDKLSVDASTRTSLKLARFMKAGIADFRLALATVVFGSLDPQEAKTAADAVSRYL